MESLDLNKKVLRITCPKCSKQFTETIGNITVKPTVKCSICGEDVTLKTDEFKEEIARIKAVIDKLKTYFKPLGD